MKHLKRYSGFRWVLYIVAAFVVVGFLGGCDETPVNPNPGTGVIKTGARVQAGTGMVSGSGGTVRVSGDTVLGGMRIDVPRGAYPGGAAFTVSYAPVTEHTFSTDFNPVSPLIRIDNGGLYADSVMTVTIPIKLPAGHFAMAFYYDETTGELEGIPVVALSADSITIATRHFGDNNLGYGKRAGGAGGENFTDLIISSIKAGELSGVIDSRFRPGTDDWEYSNNGSYIALPGHCTGQSLTAMWYYAAQRLKSGAPTLNSRFDTEHTDSMWMDNPRGYRFASVVWADLKWTDRTNWMTKFDNLGTKAFSRDSLHLLAFAYGMKMTGRPQLTEIWHYNAATANWSGHAMIVYQVNGTTLSIADPNFPGNSNRQITMTNGRFDPYRSGQDADGAAAGGTAFEHITYVAKTALTSFQGISDRWDQFKNGTIGTVAPNVFPAVELQYRNANGVWIKAEDTVHAWVDTVVFRAVCPTCAYTFPGQMTDIKLTYENGKLIQWSNHGLLKLTLRPGKQRYGVTIYGSAADPNKTKYINFQWLVIDYAATYPKISMSLTGRHLMSDGQVMGMMGVANFANQQQIPLVWKDKSFSVHGQLSVDFGLPDPITLSVDVQGAISADGKSVSMTTKRHYDWTYAGTRTVFDEEFRLTNLPLEFETPTLSMFTASGQAARNYFTVVKYSLESFDDKGALQHQMLYSSTDWDNASNPAKLSVSFLY